MPQLTFFVQTMCKSRALVKESTKCKLGAQVLKLTTFTSW